MNRRIITTLCLMAVTIGMMASNDVKTAQNLARRILGNKARTVVFRKIDATKDVFTLESNQGKVVISANNANSMAMGLNHYLKNYCHTAISWYKDDPIELPETMPAVKEKVRIESRLPMRFFLNYCTYGYSLPWWTWREWEHFIDWMALNGVNMPLAITGQESTWYNVWKKFGLNDEEIRSFFSGPAYLGWHRMCNFDAFMGPLPRDWMDRQQTLQKQILKRQRELNMTPVLSGFAGHVPAKFVEKHKGLKYTDVSYWGSFKDPERYRCRFLFATDPMFAKIQRAFIEEQTRMYGTDHMYCIDPFNEVDPPTFNCDSLAMLSRGIYESLAAADKDAHWLQMSWTYKYMPGWNGERMKALFRGVPQGRLIMLDYWCENVQMWKTTESFYGQPFIWCYLNNFGGRNRLVAPSDRIYNYIDNTYEKAGSNFSGVGATLEALDVNQFAFSMLFDKAWNMPGSLNEWRNSLADQRMGRIDEKARKVYRDYCERVLDVPRTYNYTFVESRPGMKKKDKCTPTREAQNEIWKEMVNLNSDRDGYKMDVVNIGRQCLEEHFYVLWRKFVVAYDCYDLKEMKRLGSEMKEVLTDEAALTACHPVFSMKRWIEQARSWGNSAEEKDYYERNARRIVTVWNNNLAGLNDYAGRPWDGLLKSFYLPRWSMFVDRAIDCRERGIEYDEDSFVKECYEFEEKFCELEVPIEYPQKQDPVQLSRQLLKKYFE